MQLVFAGLEPSRAESSGTSVGDGASVVDATGLAVSSVGTGLGLTGSGDEVGPADDDDVADGDDDSATSSCIAPAGPAVVDEHPATAAVTSTNPMVSSVMRVLIAFSDLSRWRC